MIDRIRFFLFCAVLSAGCLLCRPAEARLNKNEIPAPELIFDPGECLTPQRVDIRFVSNPDRPSTSRTQSAVTLHIRNTCAQDVTHSIHFNGGYDESYDELSFRHLRLAVNGRKTPLQEEQKAIRDGKDISAELSALGLPLELPQYWSSVIGIDEYEKNMIEDFHLADPKFKIFLREDLMPDWEVHYDFSFEQVFPANSITTIQYTSFLYDGNLSLWFRSDHLSRAQKADRLQEALDCHRLTACLSGRGLLRDVIERYGDHPYGNAKAYWNSVALGAAKWKQPIGLLRIKYETVFLYERLKPFFRELVIFCIDGNPHVVTDKFELAFINYRPEEHSITFQEFSFLLPEKYPSSD
jgi:hypothetical protein